MELLLLNFVFSLILSVSSSFTNSEVTEISLGPETSVVDKILGGCSDSTEVMCMLEARRIINKWLDINNKRTVLVAGKTGTGKTRLIKGLVQNITEVTGENERNLFPKTYQVQPYEHFYKESKIVFYDTPGLVDTEKKEDGTNDRNYDYLQDMVNKQLYPDVIVFFISMYHTAGYTLQEEDKYVIKNVSHAFGWARWRYAMFVLSFANMVRHPDAETDPGSPDDKFHFSQTLTNLRFQIEKLLKELRVQKDVLFNIPIIPVGLVDEPVIVADPEKHSWVDQFWKKVDSILQASQEDKKKENEDRKRGRRCACPEETKEDQASQEAAVEEPTTDNSPTERPPKDEI